MQGNGEMMNSVYRLRIFTTCEISQVVKIFTTWEIFKQNFAPPILEHLQQHKTKNYEKIRLKNKEIYKIWKLKAINENPNLQIEIK